MLGISGASGSGKSTLLAVLCGWEQPESGTVTHPGGPVADLPWSELALVPQTLGLLEDLTVAENIKLGGRLARPSAKRRTDDDGRAANSWTGSACAISPRVSRRRSRSASSNARRWPAACTCVLACCSPTSRPRTRTAAGGKPSSTRCATTPTPAPR